MYLCNYIRLSVYSLHTGSEKNHSYWAKAVAPHVSLGRCIAYVDFVADVVPPALKLSEMFGLKTGSYYGRIFSGHDKDEVLQSCQIGVIKVMVATTVSDLHVGWTIQMSRLWCKLGFHQQWKS